MQHYTYISTEHSSALLSAQIQAILGEGHVNIIETKELLLTETHLAIVMECAEGNSLTGYVADQLKRATVTGLYLGEDECRYFFRVSTAQHQIHVSLDMITIMSHALSTEHQ